MWISLPCCLLLRSCRSSLVSQSFSLSKVLRKKRLDCKAAAPESKGDTHKYRFSRVWGALTFVQQIRTSFLICWTLALYIAVCKQAWLASGQPTRQCWLSPAAYSAKLCVILVMQSWCEVFKAFSALIYFYFWKGLLSAFNHSCPGYFQCWMQLCSVLG